MKHSEEIIKVIKRSGKKGLSLREIINRTQLEQVEVLQLLTNMERNFQIMRTKGDKYVSKEDEKHFSGVLAMSDKGYGFLIPNDAPAVINAKIGTPDDNKDRIFIANKNLNGAIHGDRIFIKTYRMADGRLCGKVVEREPSIKRYVGTIFEKKNVTTNEKTYYVRLDDKKYPFPVRLLDTKGGSVDSEVVVTFDSEKQNGEYVGNVVKVLGHKGDPGVDILKIVEECGIPYGENKKALIEANKIPDVLSQEALKERLDLRDEVIFTIDGKDAKDYDDAVSIKRLENGNYLLGVHIADVSEYVKEHSELDKEAYLRGTSVYLADRVIPMIPHKLSDGICSLIEGENRLTTSVLMQLDPKGNVVDYDIKKSVICSKKRMRYDEVNKVLLGEVVEGYEPFQENLLMMLQLSHIIREKKKQRGTISFDKGEVKPKINARGEAIYITKRERGEAERIIEDFMIAANETVASYLSQVVPVLYRIHEVPDREKLDKMNDILSTIGCELELPLANRPIKAKEFQQAIEKYIDNENYDIITDVALRAMKKAIYSSSNEHHFALASDYYTHFTSPIRRYPDLIVHRILSRVLNGTYDYQNTDKELDYLMKSGEHTSMCERRAEDCERKVTQMKIAEYMERIQKLIDSGMLEPTVYDAKITWINKKGMYVELENLIRGLIPADSIAPAMFDQTRLTYISPNYVYQLGKHVGLVLVNANKEEKTVLFHIATEDEKEQYKQYQKVLDLSEFGTKE